MQDLSIETLEQLVRLRGLKCKFGQEYFFSRPVDSTAAGELLAQQFDRLVVSGEWCAILCGEWLVITPVSCLLSAVF